MDPRGVLERRTIPDVIVNSTARTAVMATRESLNTTDRTNLAGLLLTNVKRTAVISGTSEITQSVPRVGVIQVVSAAEIEFVICDSEHGVIAKQSLLLVLPHENKVLNRHCNRQ